MTLALLCSTRAPAGILLAVHDLAQRWRHDETTIISGFHSPVEREAFIVLLRGPGKIVWVPARSVPSRLAPEVRGALEAGFLSIISIFDDTVKRATREMATERNRYICDMADAVLIAYAHPGSATESLAHDLSASGKPVFTLVHPANEPLLSIGVRVYPRYPNQVK